MTSISEIIVENPKRAIVPNMDRHKYRDCFGINPSSLSAGLMSDWDVDPRSIKDAYESVDVARTGAQKDRMDRGTLAHLALLQPEKMASDVAVWNGGRRSGSVWEEFRCENERRLIVTEDDYTDVMSTVNKLRSIPLVAELLCDIEPEVAVFTAVKAGGFTFQARGQLDAIRRSGIYRIVDIKTTEAGIDQRSCERTIESLHYREKMALYRDWIAAETGVPAEEWICSNLFLSLGGRPGVREMRFTSSALEWGRYRMQGALTAVAECMESKVWPVFCKSDLMDVKPWEIENEPDEDIDYGNG